MTSGDSPTEQLIVPSVSTTVRDTMVADVGTIIYNTSTNKLNVCISKAAGSGNWEAVTSS